MKNGSPLPASPRGRRETIRMASLLLGGAGGGLYYDKNLISTPAATAEPITPEMLEDMQ